MAKILIIGCGAIGYKLATLLTGQGHDVTGLKRNTPTQGDEKFSYYRADIGVPADLAGLNTDFDFIFFIVSADSRNENSYREIYDVGLNNVINHFAQANSQARWIFVSSTSVYGQNQGEWVDEDSPSEPVKTTSLEIVKAEQKLIALNPRNIIVRFSGIYGPGREYLLRLAQQSPAIQKQPPYFTNRIHEQDCVGVLAFLLEQSINDVKLEQRYLASDDNPAPMWEVISWLAQQMRCPPAVEKLTDEGSGRNKRCRNDRIKRLGYRFAYPNYKSGYLELIKQYKPP